MTPTRILVVELESHADEDIRHDLEGLGYVVTAVVGTLLEARQRLAEIRPDIVLMDSRLRGEMELLNATEQTHDHLDLPVVYVLANADPQTVAQARATEPPNCVIRPFSSRELLCAIELARYKYHQDRKLTEHKQLEARFLRAQRLESLGVLSTGIAHDLNNVLAPIVMALQYLRQSILNPEDQTMLATLEASALRGANIVKQVLIFARGIEGDRSLLQPTYLLKEVGQIARETFPKTIQLRLNYPPNAWAITGDATQLQQVLLNLCVNARDAMPQGGALTIDLANTFLDDAYAQMNPEAKAGTYVVITVTDTGVGIAPENLEKIFEPFYSSKAVGQGCGLGLSTALSIVKSHGGFMQVKSEIGRGSEFKAYFPATILDGTPAPVDLLPAPSRGQGECVLVVDDEEAVQDITRQILVNSGYQVLTANDGTEAVTLFAEHENDIKVVIVDMMMPLLDGVATIRTLRNLNPNVAVIACSGSVFLQQQTASLEGGVQAFLPKPFTAEILLRTLHDVIERI